MDCKEKVWIYARDYRGYNKVKIQVDELMVEAAESEYEVVGVSADIAYHNVFARDGLRQMLKSVRDDEVDVVLVTRLGKLSHRNWCLKYILRVMRKHDVSLHIAKEDGAFAFYRRRLKPEQLVNIYI